MRDIFNINNFQILELKLSSHDPFNSFHSSPKAKFCVQKVLIEFLKTYLIILSSKMLIGLKFEARDPSTAWSAHRCGAVLKY